MIPFLLCPLNPRFPSAFLPVGMVSSNLQYTTGDVDRFLSQIRSGLLAAKFGHIVNGNELPSALQVIQYWLRI